MMKTFTAGVLLLALFAGASPAIRDVVRAPQGKFPAAAAENSQDPNGAVVVRLHARNDADSPAQSPRQLASGAQSQAIRSAFALPAAFERNVGENPRGVQFTGRAAGMNVALTNQGIDIYMAPDSRARSAADELSMRVRGSGAFTWQGSDKAPGAVSYFLGNDPHKWRRGVEQFSRVEASNPSGVGLAVYADAASQNSQGVEYDLRAAPSVNTARLRLDLNGASDLHLDRAGNLLMRVGARQMRMNAPMIYEQIATNGPNTHRKTASSGRTRKGTGSHRPIGARRQAIPRRGTSGGADPAHRRLRKSMHQYPQQPRKRRRNTTPKLPIHPGSTSPEPAPEKQSQPQPSGAAHKETKGRRVRGGYVLEADGSVGLWVGQHDPRATLVFDPSLSITYTTFLGGTGAESANSVAMDVAGNVYIAGTTTSASGFPEGANSTWGTARGAQQLFIAKIAPTPGGPGTLEYLAFFGGSATQAGGQVAVDAAGNAALLGVTTSPDYPVTNGSTPTLGLTGGAGNDLVISEVDPTGTNLLFSTLFGGSGTESQTATTGIPLNSSQNIPAAEGGIAFDAAGNIYVASDTTSLDLPVTVGAFQPIFGGKGATDGFFAEFDPGIADGAPHTVYCSYLGTAADHTMGVGGVAVDSASPPNVYVAGYSSNGIFGFPAKNAFQSSYGGGSDDAFAMKILPAGSGPGDLIYVTLLGGSGIDQALGIAVDTATPANAYVVGLTQSPAFPDQPVVAGPSTALHAPGPAHSAAQPQNAFLAEIAWNSATSQTVLQYLTYLGGAETDAAQSVDAIFSNAVYVAGTATSFDFGWHDNVQAFNGATDAFVAKLDTTQSGATSLLYATPLGGTAVLPGSSVVALGNGVAAKPSGQIYLAGATTAPNFPTAATSGGSINGFQQVCGSCQESPAASDAFLAGLRESASAQSSLTFSTGSVNFGSNGVLLGSSGVPQLFAISNSGETPLQISQASPPALGGPNAADFALLLSPACAQAIAPGANCQAQVSFTPSTSGVEGAVISVTDNAPGSPHILEVTGTGTGPLLVSPASLVFQSAPVNSANPQKIAVTLTAGASTVENVNVAASGQDPDLLQFTFVNPLPLSPCSSTTLEANQSCQFGYEFVPKTTGTFHAEVDVTYELNGIAQPELKLPMSGAGVAPAPLAVVHPAALSFAGQVVGTKSTAQTVSVTNRGTAPLLLTQAISFTGPNPLDFTESDNCGSTVAVGANCTISVAFAPRTAGSRSADLSMADNVTGSPQIVALTGTALATPIVQLSPPSLSFAQQSVLTSSAAQTISVNNAGQATLIFNTSSAIAITGTNFADFTATNNCPASLAVGAGCSVSVQFFPQTPGAKQASVTFTDSATGSPQTVPLTGTAVALAIAQIAPTALSFAPQAIASLSASVPITIANIGTASLTVLPLSVSGLNASDFSETDNCGTFGPGAHCTVQVVFMPTAAGARTATLSIADNAAGSPQTVLLSGTGIQASATIAPPSLSFAGQTPGTSSAAQTITITNAGVGQIRVASIVLSGTNSRDFSETDNCIGANITSSCAIQVAFTPTCAASAPAARSASLTIQDNGSTSTVVVPLSGQTSGDFCIVPAGLNSTVVSGSMAVFQATIVALGSFTGTVSLACTSSPAVPSCAFTPSSSIAVSPNVPQAFQVQANTAIASSNATPSPWRGFDDRDLLEAALGLLLLLLMLFTAAGKLTSRRRLALTSIAVLVLCVGMASCGSGSTTAPDPPATAPSSLAAGTYKLTVTATDANEAPVAVSFQLNVTPKTQ